MKMIVILKMIWKIVRKVAAVTVAALNSIGIDGDSKSSSTEVPEIHVGWSGTPF